MAGMRPTGYAGELERMVFPGDVMVAGEVISKLTTVGSGTVTAAMIATGILNRTGPAGGFTDTFDSAANIIAALGGAATGTGATLTPGSTFRFRYINSVALAMTFAAGIGIVSGIGTLNVAASVIRDYLFTVLNASPPVSLNCTFLTASTIVTFVLPPNMTSFPMGAADNPQGIAITPGMGVTDATTGASISAATTVVGVTQGVGGVTGVTLNQNTAGASAALGDSLNFFPRVQIDSLGSLAA